MPESRILAIDLRSRLLGFAVLEGPRTLLDFGRKPYYAHATRDRALVVRMRIANLLAFYGPSVIVLKSASVRSGPPILKLKDAVGAIRSEAKLQSLELVFLKRRAIHQSFRQSGKSNKYKIAGLIAGVFPELAWKLPANRKNWQPEHHNAIIFDAISLGLAYFAQVEKTLPNPPQAIQEQLSS